MSWSDKLSVVTHFSLVLLRQLELGMYETSLFIDLLHLPIKSPGTFKDKLNEAC